MASLLRDLVGERQGDFVEFCRKQIVLDNGKPYDPLGRACMVEVVESIFRHPHVTIEKGEQTGLSTLFIADALYMTDQHRRNVMYFGPTDEWMKDFTPTRFDPTIARSPYLSSRLQGSDAVGLKQIGSNFLYLRGLKTKSKVVSVPADVLLFDEVALLDKENMETAEGRLSASELAWRRYFSAPLFEEDVIDELFQASDQRSWMIKCQHCGTRQVAEENFPGCLVQKNGVVFVACSHCGKPLDVAKGEWVAKHPDRSDSRLGYRIPQLIIPGLNLQFAYDRVQEALRKPSKLAQVTRSVAGIPRADSRQPVNDLVIKRVSDADPFYLQTRSELPCFMGIDMGDTCHVAIRQPIRGGQVRWVHFQEVSEDELLATVAQLEEAYDVRGTVIDAMPYKPSSKKVVRQLKRWAAIHYFRGDELKEDQEGQDDKAVVMVLSEREESIDDMIDELIAEPPIALLPQPRDTQQEQLIRSVHRHLKKLVREERTVGANKMLAYKDGVENHFGLAMTYAVLAQTMHRDNKFEYTPVTEAARRAKFGKGAY